MKIYNTMSRHKEVFKPLEKGVVKMYNCGLTVYEYNTIGNLRTALVDDILRRWLEYRGFRVRQVMNFTDVGHLVGDADMSAEDKMALAAKRENISAWDIADFYINAALKDYRLMNFLEPEIRPRATHHVPEMINLAKELVDKGSAYVVNGSVYFNISKFKRYGKLSHNTIKKLMAGAGGRVESNPDKRNQLDFALWIADPEHIMKWESPWSVGYPGWHIECSAMIMRYLGTTIDIHTGGEDNIFPHHESEIAQSESATGQPFANYWIHVRHLLVNNEKMSKSKGNFYTLRDLMAKGYGPKDLRYLLITSHYRDKQNFTFKSLDAAKSTVASLLDFVDKLRDIKSKAKWNEELHDAVVNAKLTFEERMDDDLDTPQALAAMHELVRKANKAIDEGKASEKNLKEIFDAMMTFDKVLGILMHERSEIPAEIKDMIAKREAARQKKDFKTADSIRKDIESKGWIVEDSPTGPRARKR